LEAGTKEESKKLSRGSGAPLGAPTNLNRLSHYIPTTGPLTSQDYWSRLEYGATETVQLKEGLRVKYAFVTQRGYYPEALDQDAVLVKKDFGGTAGQMFFGVFDGHGIRGEEAAQFAKAKVTHPTTPRHTKTPPPEYHRKASKTSGSRVQGGTAGIPEGDVSVARVVQCIYSSA